MGEVIGAWKGGPYPYDYFPGSDRTRAPTYDQWPHLEEHLPVLAHHEGPQDLGRSLHVRIAEGLEGVGRGGRLGTRAGVPL
jgi:hypothetical protein